MTDRPLVWSIAGSDSSGCAGLQADVKTGASFGVHIATVVTCVTAQGKGHFSALNPVSRDTLRAQLEALKADGLPAAIKLGALGSRENAESVCEFLTELGAAKPLVVWDPVHRASAGGDLGPENNATNGLLALADIVTPNAPELVALGEAGAGGGNAALALSRRAGVSVYAKGGHTETPGQDYWADTQAGHSFTLQGTPVNAGEARGTGCALATALACARALGHDGDEAPVLAHMYVHQGLRTLAQGGAAENARPLPHDGWPRRVADLPRVFDGPEASARLAFPTLAAPLGLYAVVPDVAWVRRCTELGVPTVQLRMKNPDATALRQAITASVALTEGTATRLFVNDHWQLAMELGAYGVHLGQEDLNDADLPALQRAGLRLGLSTHSYYEIARAHGAGPSYIAIGPIYPTTTKVMRFAAQGLVKLQRWVELLKPLYPLTAIGGIDLTRAPGVLATGVDSFAVVRAITEAEDPARAVEQLSATFPSRR